MLKVNVKLGGVTSPWMKSRHELETVNNYQPTKNSGSSKNVAKMIDATSSEGFPNALSLTDC